MGISIRRACKVLQFDTSTYHYKCRRTGQIPLERRIKDDLRDTRALWLPPRPCAFAPPELEDQHEEDTQDLQRARASTAQQASQVPGGGKAQRRSLGGCRTNDVWAMDFVHDQLATGKKLRILTSLTRTRTTAPPPTHASPIAARMSPSPWRASAERPAIPRRSV